MISKVKVGAIAYAVIQDGTLDDVGLHGRTSFAKAQISIASGMNDAYSQHVLWHELVHVIMTHAGIPNEQQSESLIDTIAFGVLQVLVDNPGIVE